MGCGNGNFLELFLKMTNKKSEIYAVDKSKDLILEASEKFKNENITFEVNDDNLPPQPINDGGMLSCKDRIRYVEEKEGNHRFFNQRHS